MISHVAAALFVVLSLLSYCSMGYAQTIPLFAFPTETSTAHPDPLARWSVRTPVATEAARANLIQTIFGTSTPATDPYYNEPTTICCNENLVGFFGVQPSSASWWAWRYLVSSSRGSYPYLTTRLMYATFPGSQCLAIVNFGHSGGAFKYAGDTYPAAFDEPTINQIVQQLAAVPCDILVNSMLLNGENRYYASYVGLDPDGWTPNNPHDIIGTDSSFTPPTGTPLQYFLGPALGAINFALKQRSYSKVIATGYSGGGWTTTLLAALEPRITHAYAVAGSAPQEYWIPPGTEGDWEQKEADIGGTSYFDLYAMGVAETGRRETLFYNGQDQCCFSWAQENLWAAPFVSAIAQAAFPGRFAIKVDALHSVHEISPQAQAAIMADLAVP